MTVVLDDDPTGTQEVTGVPVLLSRDPEALERLLGDHDAVFVLTNTRAMPEDEATALIRALIDDVHRAERVLGVTALVVQRGDSTLRGHVFAEIDAAGGDDVVVFCPAFPAGGRRTVDGVHLVNVSGEWLNAADTEFADDPVFGYTARSQVEYVGEKGRGRTGVSVGVSDFAEALRTARPRTVLLPDAQSDEEIRTIAGEIENAVAEGARIVVRSAAPLAAYLAHAKSAALLDPDRVAAASAGSREGGVLVVVGSHTGATGEQLAALLADGVPSHELSTDAALEDAGSAGRALADAARAQLREGAVVISSERHRRAEHATLDHAEAVMRGLTTATAALADGAIAVVAKGGITSAEVARTGLGRRTAWVAGQLLPGVSLWIFSDDPSHVDRPGLLYAVVPGNIGTEQTLRQVFGIIRDAVATGVRA
ncbi:four-carbon acid sugar kinase family protein [Microbacterium tumbae]